MAKNASRDMSLAGIAAAKISPSVDITDDNYTCKSNLIRIAALADSRVKNLLSESTDPGISILYGTIEYFSVNEGDVITITGTVNISSIL